MKTIKRIALVLFGILATIAPVRAQTHTFPATDTNNTFTGTNTFQGPTFVNITTIPISNIYAVKGTTVQITNGASASDCTTGGGSTVVSCQYGGSVWAAIAGGTGCTISGGSGTMVIANTGACNLGHIVDDGSTLTATESIVVPELNATIYADQQSGSDAGAKISAAIALLPSTGGTVDATGLQGAQSFTGITITKNNVHIKTGAATFTHSTVAFTVNADNFELECSGGTDFVAANSSNANWMDYATDGAMHTGFYVHGCQSNGNASNQTLATYAIQSATANGSMTNFKIENNYLHDHKRASNAGNEIQLNVSGTTHGVISNNICLDHSCVGVFGTDIVISNNIAINSDDDAFAAVGGPDLPVSSIVFDSNIVDGTTAGHGIDLVNCHSCTVTGNTVSGADVNGILLWDNDGGAGNYSADSTVTGNTVTGTVVNNGIEIEGQRVSVTGNTVKTSNLDGILVADGSADVTVTGNTTMDNGASVSGGLDKSGIRVIGVSNNTSDILVNGNTSGDDGPGTQSYGFQAGGSDLTRTYLLANIFQGNVVAGYDFSSGTDAIASGNSVNNLMQVDDRVQSTPTFDAINDHLRPQILPTPVLSSYADVTEISAPSNPPSGFERLYGSSSTHQFSCLTSSGGNCAPSGGSAFSGGLGTSYQDVTETAAPANPASGNDRLYLDSTAHQFKCLTSSGGSCMPSSGGGVTSVGLSAPSWFAVGGSPVTSSGTLALTPQTGQSSHQVIGTCGTATSFGPCSLVAGDIPILNQNTTGSAASLSGTQTDNFFYAAPNGSSGAGGWRAIVAADIPTLNQSTTGTAANLSGTPALPNGTTATTQTTGDNTTKIATDAFVLANALANPMTTPGDMIVGGASGASSRLAVNSTSVPETPVSVGGATSLQPSGVNTRASTCTSNVDTILSTDRASYVSENDASACAVTIPQAGSTNFANNFVFSTCNIGAGTATYTPTTSTISYSNGSTYTSGATNMSLTTGQCAFVYSDNTNYFAIKTPSVGSGTVTSVVITGTANEIATSGTCTITATGTCTLSLTNGGSLPGAWNLGTPSSLNLTNALDLPCGALPPFTGHVTTSGCTTTVSLTIPMSCEIVWGGTNTGNALQSGDDAIADQSCYNKKGVTETITAVYCRSDAASNTTTVNPTFGTSGTGTTILSGALTCGSSGAYSSTGTVTNASLTDGSNINPVMGGTLTGTSIHLVIEYTIPQS